MSLRDVKPNLLADEIYTVVDGYFSKQKFVDGVRELALHQIGKLRCDANMRYLYTGPKRGTRLRQAEDLRWQSQLARSVAVFICRNTRWDRHLYTRSESRLLKAQFESRRPGR